MNTRKHIQPLVLLFTLLFLLPNFNHGQYQISSKEEIEGFKSIPSETVFVHYNESLLLVGEYLYYKIYCLQAADLIPSPISKIGYVELVGKDKKIVFRHKVPLISGMGQGDFFIPTTVPTGNYKLIGYTRWMFNAEHKNFFTADINIINPYQELPKTESSKIEIGGSPARNTDESSITDSIGIHEKSPFPKIKTDRAKYGRRERVSLKISTGPDSQFHGNFSLSVRKRYAEIPNTKVTATQFSLNPGTSEKPYVTTINNRIYLPELRGELISGKVVSKADNSPMRHGKLSLSYFGDHPNVQIVNTNGKGVFYSGLNQMDRRNLTTLQVLGVDKDQWLILLDSLPRPEHDNLNFQELSISPNLNPLLLKRSIYNQVENAYFEQKPDSTAGIDSELPVYHALEETYILDDYTRFPTLKETVVEIINGVLLRKVKGKFKFQVRSDDSYLLTPDDTPLVLVDGLLLEDLSDLVSYGVEGIERIGISRHEYYMGPKLYKGIVSVTTKENDFLSKTNPNHVQQLKIASPISLKQYFFQDYVDQMETKHLPDYRHQLLWKPDLELKKEETTLVFYTSDNTGEYEISLEGFTQGGKPVSISDYILVE
ncbi:hypothetical protein [Ulvibacterium sp.]|uniref:hypothetical protein n=1 Tax=Ulvibacterium sp. TaxID=2665914 RepID=UPI00262B3F22|nr:hypothetical protein [Ulvibacterium sp.]